jgi:hypothetical protein
MLTYRRRVQGGARRVAAKGNMGRRSSSLSSARVAALQGGKVGGRGSGSAGAAGAAAGAGVRRQQQMVQKQQRARTERQ